MSLYSYLWTSAVPLVRKVEFWEVVMERVRALGEHGDINGEILVSIVTQHCPDHVDAVLLLKSKLKSGGNDALGKG